MCATDWDGGDMASSTGLGVHEGLRDTLPPPCIQRFQSFGKRDVIASEFRGSAPTAFVWVTRNRGFPLRVRGTASRVQRTKSLVDLKS